MTADYPVFIDACVLANFGVADLLMRLAEKPRQYLPKWSEPVLAEVKRTHIEKLGWGEEMAGSFSTAIRSHFPEAMVSGFDHLMPAMTNEESDRHVLAAAVHSGCDMILTFNLKDFPDESLAPWKVRAWHPERYLITLFEMDEGRVRSVIGDIARRKGEDAEDVLIRLGHSVPAFSRHVITDPD